MIDRIEYNVSQAVNYVGEAKVQTTKALKYQKKARRVRSLRSWAPMLECL